METDPLPYLTVFGPDVQGYPDPAATIAGILFIVILLFLSALISGAEAAYFSFNLQDRLKQDKNKDRHSASILRNLENPEKLLATIQVANNLINLAIIVLSLYVANLLINFSEATTADYMILTGIIAFFLLFFGEILPKVYAGRHAVKVARIMAFPLIMMERVFRPLNTLLIYSSSMIRKRAQDHSQTISLDELSQAFELNRAEENYEEKEILEGIVKFGHKNVAEIMRSRVDVVALNLKDSFEKVINLINDSGYSRIPVYSGSFDHIRGILYIKDLLPFINKKETFHWQSIIRPPFYVPETKKIDDLLEEFQKNKVHMAIVVDEYGGSSGIVTLEDILEEIVGDIPDEFDEDEHYSTRISENKYLFDGKVQLNDFYKFTGCDNHVFDDCKGDADTLAGLILEIKGEIPMLNEKISCKNFIFAIDAVDSRRIKKIRVEIT
ncbi:MAG: gliding motility-associated protein GldE [Mangrovibacterium sp.]